MCWFSIAKYLLFAFNFVLWLGGIAILGIGIYLLAGPSDAVVNVGDVNFYTAGAALLIVAGTLAFAMGFLGCCGAKEESTCMLGLYFIALLVILILEVGVGIWALVNYDSVGAFIDDQLYRYDLTNDSDSVAAYMDMEERFHCCGKNNTCVDWLTAGQPEPYGCDCDKGDPHCVPLAETSCDGKFDNTKGTYNYIYNQNCTTAVTTYVTDNATVLGGVCLAIGLVEIIGMIFSICMCCAIKEKQGYS